VAADRTLYEILGVSADATEDEVRAAYRRLVRQIHPDTGGSAAIFGIVHEAYEVLRDPQKRAEYDRAQGGAASRARSETPAPPPSQSTSSGRTSPGPDTSPPNDHLHRNSASDDGQRSRRIARRGVVTAGLAVLVAVAITKVVQAEDQQPSSSADRFDLSQPTSISVSVPTDEPIESPAPTLTPTPTPVRTSAAARSSKRAVPVSPCAAFAHVHASYVIASTRDSEIDEVDYWPRVTVHNATKHRVIVAFEGSGKAANPEFPDSPMEMDWGVDDSPLSVAPGHTTTADLGKKYGEVLASFNGGRITRFKITAAAGYSDDFVYGDGSSCPLKVIHS
jgi:DnaJ domain